jgi:hypothetical protein
VPETVSNARFCFAALGRGAIGWSPFGLDYTAYVTEPMGATRETEESLAQVALNYKTLQPIMREVARLNFEGNVQTAIEEPGQTSQTLDFGNWTAVVSYGGSRRGGAPAAPRTNAVPMGRALVAKIAENQFWVAGAYCRVDFRATAGGQRDFLRVEEVGVPEGKKAGSAKPGEFRVLRFWNGEETDNALNFTSAPQPLRVLLGTY